MPVFALAVLFISSFNVLSEFNSSTHCLNFGEILYTAGGGGVLPYMGNIGVCRCEGYGVHAVYCGIYKSESLGPE